MVVVSHSGFMRTAVVGRWFGNADYRVFDLGGCEGREGEGGLVEWELTRGRGGMGRSREEKVVVGEKLPEV